MTLQFLLGVHSTPPIKYCTHFKNQEFQFKQYQIFSYHSVVKSLAYSGNSINILIKLPPSAPLHLQMSWDNVLYTSAFLWVSVGFQEKDQLCLSDKNYKNFAESRQNCSGLRCGGLWLNLTKYLKPQVKIFMVSVFNFQLGQTMILSSLNFLFK